MFRILRIYIPLLFRRPALVVKIAKGYFKTIFLHKPVLKSIEFSVTTKCNSNCQTCFAKNYLDSARSELSAKEIASVWQQAKNLGAIGSYLLGGEPTLRSDLFEILAALEAKTYLVGIVTNSLLLTDELAHKLKDAGVTFLSLSLDSMKEEENDAIRNYPGHYKKVMEAIKLSKKYGFRTDISYVLSHSSLRVFEEFIGFALKIGVDYVAPSVMLPVGKWADNEKEILDEDDWRQINSLLRRYSCLKFDFLQSFSGRQMCPGGIEKLGIGPYGDVMTCNVNPVSFGNVREEQLEILWKRSHEFKFFRLGRNYKNCVVSGDHEYIQNILHPVGNIRKQPVFYKQYPDIFGKYFDK